jgi:hypothetical protein
MSQQSPLSERSYFEKYKKPIRVSIAIIFLVIVLVIPIIPIQKTVTKTRTRNLQYSSQVYGQSIGLFIPKSVKVTNTDSIGGTFSITMNMWSNDIVRGVVTPRLDDTSTQSSFISAKATHTFSLPDNWFIMEPMYSLTYSVSAPSTQVTYNVTQTEYKSMLDLLFES